MHNTIKRVDLLYLLHRPTENKRIVILLFNLCGLSLCLSLRINGYLVISSSFFIICCRTPTSFYIKFKLFDLHSPPAAAALLLLTLSLIIIIIINKMFKKRDKPNNSLKRTNEDRYHDEGEEKEEES
jgi:RING finger protein 113A